MTATTKMAPLFAVMLLTLGLALDDVVALPRGEDGSGEDGSGEDLTVPGRRPSYVGRSGADLLLNSSQPDGAVLLNGHDIVSGVSLMSSSGRGALQRRHAPLLEVIIGALARH